MKERRFGKVIAFQYKQNDSAVLPGVSIKLDPGKQDDCFDGKWLRLAEAKRLHTSLGKAISHIEAAKARE